MFYLLNRNTRIQLFFILLLLVWSAITIFTKMDFISPYNQMILFQLILKLATSNPLLLKTLSLLILIVSTLGLIRYFKKQKFYEYTSLMPGIFFLLLINFGHYLQTFNPSLITILFLTIVMMIFTPGASPSKMKNHTLTFGLLIATATLIDFSAFGIVLFLIFIIATNSISPVKDTIILFSGLALPYIVVISVYYLCNKLSILLESWQQLEFFSPIENFLSLSIINYMALAFYMLIIIIFLFRGRHYFENRLIKLRQAFTGIHIQYISMATFMLFGGSVFMPALIYIAPSTAEYMSISILKKRYRFLYDILIITMLTLLWL